MNYFLVKTFWIHKENLTQILFFTETKSIFSKTNARGWDKSKYKFPKYKYDRICFMIYLNYCNSSDKNKKYRVIKTLVHYNIRGKHMTFPQK